MHVLLLQDPQPELVPEQSDPPQLTHQHLHLHTQEPTKQLLHTRAFNTITYLQKSKGLSVIYLQHHGGVGRGELVYNLAVAVLHHGLVLARIHHHLLTAGALLRSRPTAHLTLTSTESLSLHVPQQGWQGRWQLITWQVKTFSLKEAKLKYTLPKWRTYWMFKAVCPPKHFIYFFLIVYNWSAVYFKTANSYILLAMDTRAGTIYINASQFMDRF